MVRQNSSLRFEDVPHGLSQLYVHSVIDPTSAPQAPQVSVMSARSVVVPTVAEDMSVPIRPCLHT